MRHIILGGTGTLGQAVALELSKNPENMITIFSRGELEQQKMKALYPQFTYIIGDIKSPHLRAAIRGYDIVYHFAALKHVDVGEENPRECTYTNTLGTFNVADACADVGIKTLVFSTTDKAVMPINNYGCSKMLAENMMKKEYPDMCKIFRWGNVIGSRGSAIPMFVEKMIRKESIPITHRDMTRYWIRIEEAARFLVKASINDMPDHTMPDGVYTPDMRGASIIDVLDAISRILKKSFDFHFSGIRAGEKIHECLYTSHTYCLNSNDKDKQYTVHELVELLRPTVERIANEMS